MICPNCSFKNIFTTVYCTRCGCTLVETAGDNCNWELPYIPTPDFEKWNYWLEIDLGEKVGFFDSPSHALFSHRCNDIAFSPDCMTMVLVTSYLTRKIYEAATRKYFKLSSHREKPINCPIRLYDPITGEFQRNLENHTKPINCIRFSRDGRLLASASDDTTIGIFNVTEDYRVRILKGHTGEVNSLAFSPDGKVLISGSNDCIIKLWDVEQGTTIKSIAGYSSFVRSVDFSWDGKIFATSSDNIIRTWDAKTFQCLNTLKEHFYSIHTVRFSPDGLYLLSCDSTESPDVTGSRMVILWDPQSGKPIRKEYVRNSSYSMDFFPDGSHFALGMTDGTINIYETDTFKRVATIGKPQLYGSSSSSSTENAVISLCFAPDGSRLVAGFYNNLVKIIR